MKKSVKNLKSGCAILFLCVLSACSSVKIQDAEWCGQSPEGGASCFNTLSDGTRDLTSDEWKAYLLDFDNPKLCTPANSFANWKAAILKFCSKFKICTFEFKKKLNEFDQKLNKAVSNAQQRTASPSDY